MVIQNGWIQGSWRHCYSFAYTSIYEVLYTMKHCSPFLKLQMKFKLGLHCKAALWVIFGELNWSSTSVHHAVIKAGLSQEAFYLWIWVFKFDYFLKQTLLVLKLIFYTLYNIRVSLGGLVIFWRAVYFILFWIRPKIQSTTKIGPKL